ncbi:MAG: putative transporter ATP-binding protein [Cyanobacteria bacterium RYN_339]|nr:putative transporter ATP-binding protein [Cyanobacteria bacterium RYN_339]
MHAVEMENLGLTLGGRPIVAGVTLRVRPGEVFGVLGPNGAGKTTTVRLLNGLLRPTSGHARVCGLDPATQGDAVRRRTGVLTEAPALYERLTGAQNLAYFAALHAIPRADRPRMVKVALSAVGLTPRGDDPAGTYSKGMQQRLAIARAILHEPEVLFLDEPTAGLDPESAERVGTLIDTWRAAGRTVFLATHHLGDAERQCDRFAFYAHGRLEAHGTKAELAHRAGVTAGVTLGFQGAVPELPAHPAVTGVERRDGELVVALAASDAIPDVVALAVAAGGRILRVEPRAASLQDLYFAIVGREGA